MHVRSPVGDLPQHIRDDPHILGPRRVLDSHVEQSVDRLHTARLDELDQPTQLVFGEEDVRPVCQRTDILITQVRGIHHARNVARSVISFQGRGDNITLTPEQLTHQIRDLNDLTGRLSRIDARCPHVVEQRGQSLQRGISIRSAQQVHTRRRDIRPVFLSCRLDAPRCPTAQGRSHQVQTVAHPLVLVRRIRRVVVQHRQVRTADKMREIRRVRSLGDRGQRSELEHLLEHRPRQRPRSHDEHIAVLKTSDLRGEVRRGNIRPLQPVSLKRRRVRHRRITDLQHDRWLAAQIMHSRSQVGRHPRTLEPLDLPQTVNRHQLNLPITQNRFGDNLQTGSFRISGHLLVDEPPQRVRIIELRNVVNESNLVTQVSIKVDHPHATVSGRITPQMKPLTAIPRVRLQHNRFVDTDPVQERQRRVHIRTAECVFPGRQSQGTTSVGNELPWAEHLHGLQISSDQQLQLPRGLLIRHERDRLPETTIPQRFDQCRRSSLMPEVPRIPDRYDNTVHIRQKIRNRRTDHRVYRISMTTVRRRIDKRCGTTVRRIHHRTRNGSVRHGERGELLVRHRRAYLAAHFLRCVRRCVGLCANARTRLALALHRPRIRQQRPALGLEVGDLARIGRRGHQGVEQCAVRGARPHGRGR
ncbi:hypothetical protein AB0M48_12190 [Lentzea sp. NPDC051208]|uniref:hypothetical protein n=1 Tax=Lentzea sp. NPDC051208 TaxID=3154642 RepID=UPI0034161223